MTDMPVRLRDDAVGNQPPRAPAGAPLLELRDIGKTYPGVVALYGVSLSLHPGEVLGLIGENGAGKSTLMKVLGGVVAPSSGCIRLGGQEHAALTVAEANRAGIAFVHQELNLFDNLDVAANVLFGREPRRGGLLNLIDHTAARSRVAPILHRLGADFGPDAPVSALSIAQRQLVEIAKALAAEARIIILDEPTSSLTLSETDRLLRVVEELRAGGAGVVLITHRLGEIIDIADRVICLRDGHLVGELPRERIEHATMVRLMIGRDLRTLYTPPARPPGEGGLAIDSLVTPAFPHRRVSLRVRPGEIMGLAGLVGAGRTSLVRTVFGMDRALSGSVRLDGEAMAISCPADAIARGIYLVPEDRKRDGLVLGMSLTENITLANLPGHARFSLVDRAAERRTADAQLAALRVKAASCAVIVGTLSGGNQQKIVLGKWLSMAPRAILFDEPTRGIDVGAKGEIYALMRALADRGVAILMISSDMEEVLGVSDRITVMHEGGISGALERDAFSEQAVLHLAIGGAGPPDGTVPTATAETRADYVAGPLADPDTVPVATSLVGATAPPVVARTTSPVAVAATPLAAAPASLFAVAGSAVAAIAPATLAPAVPLATTVPLETTVPLATAVTLGVPGNPGGGPR